MIDLQKKCLRCTGLDIVFDVKSGDLICRQCGEINASRVIDESAEWTDYQEDDKDGNGDAGRAENHRKTILDCQTSFSGGSVELRNSLHNAQSSIENRLKLKAVKSVEIVGIMGEALRTSQAIQRAAADIFTRAIVDGIYHLSDFHLLAATSIYIASRVYGYPRLLYEISSASSVPASMISKYQKNLCDAMNIQLGKIQAESLIPRITKYFNLPSQIVEYCRQTCSCIEKSAVLESAPAHIHAATSILLVCMYLVETGINVKTSPQLSSSSSALELGSALRSVSVATLAPIVHISVLSLSKAYGGIKQLQNSFLPSSILGNLTSKANTTLSSTATYLQSAKTVDSSLCSRATVKCDSRLSIDLGAASQLRTSDEHIKRKIQAVDDDFRPILPKALSVKKAKTWSENLQK